ncbi:serine/threonine protein kinase, partial [Myxococcota bacterium]|nr:serine/threonine protein kinase [Myxococcota bacterium]
MKKAPNNPSVLDVYLAKVRAKPEVSPGLDADAPPVGGDGDPRYAVGPELGRGGSASVLLGVDRHLRRTVAIKVLPESDRRDPDIVQAFLEEAVITGGLTHPNIVPAFDLSYSEEIGLYYTMRRLTGRSLERVLADLRHGDEHARRVFTPFKLLGIFVDICRAVAYAHSRGVIHTDLKPANVLVGEQAEVAVADWGLAQVVGPDGQRQARARLMGGTPSYMSPEQIDSPSTDLDQQADVWSLGVILYELLTLTRPFTATTVPGIFAAIARGHVVPPSDRAPERGVPRALDPVVLRALQRDKAQRYATVKELLADVEDWMEGTRERMRRVEEARAAAERARA